MLSSFNLRHRIYRVRIPEGGLKVFIKALDEREAGNQFDVLHFSKFNEHYADVMVGPSALREFKILMKSHNVSAKIIESDVER